MSLGRKAGVSRSEMAFADGDPLASRGTGEEMTISLKVNGSRRSVPAEADTPLLYALRNDLALNGAQFGCGLAQCGACTVPIDGRAARSCVTQIGALGDAEIITIEGLGAVDKPHPLQRAFRHAAPRFAGHRRFFRDAEKMGLDQNPRKTTLTLS
jgi:2Fe-2S iron-sulfur cluster binding domain